MLLQRIHTFFKNRLQERHKEIREAEAKNALGDMQPGEAVKREDSEAAKRQLAPLLKNLKARTPAASNMWAAKHKDKVAIRHKELGGGIGMYQRAKAELFQELSPEEQAKWTAIAQEAKDKRQADPDTFFEYVPNAYALRIQPLTNV